MFFDRNRGSGIDFRSTFGLTEAGRAKLEQFDGSPQMRILMSLETEGSMDVQEIAHRAHMSAGGVERILAGMMKRGYISQVGAGGGMYD